VPTAGQLGWQPAHAPTWDPTWPPGLGVPFFVWMTLPRNLHWLCTNRPQTNTKQIQSSISKIQTINKQINRLSF
jgi:hypothetical protein